MAATIIVVALLITLVAWVVYAVRSGWRDRSTDFIHRAPLGGDASAELTAELFDRVLPVLVAEEFTMVASGGHTTILERRPRRPVWPAVLAVVLFPFGLLALLAYAGRGAGDTITFVAGSGSLEVRGRCGRLTADYLMEAVDEAAAESARTV